MKESMLNLYSVAFIVAAIVILLHFLNRHRWDNETARLKAKGLPWILLLIFTFPVSILIASLICDQRGGCHVLLLLFLCFIFVRHRRRVRRAKILAS